jgi:hypothetical protein
MKKVAASIVVSAGLTKQFEHTVGQLIDSDLISNRLIIALYC